MVTHFSTSALRNPGSVGSPSPRIDLRRSRCSQSIRKPRQQMRVSASSERSGGFTAGFLTGGIIFGALGFLFAPQISKALLTEDQKLKLPRFLEDEVKDPERTKQELSDKIAQLNAAIDDVSSQMKAKDPKPEIIAEELPAQS